MFLRVVFSLLLLQAFARAADEGMSLSLNPFRCTADANDHDTCVQLKHCSWCQGDGLPGICVSDTQAKALIDKIPHVKCWQDDVQKSTFLRATKPEIRLPQQLVPYDPKCLNAPSATGPDDEDEDVCNATSDSQGLMCVWCDASGVFGICLSHEQAQKASSYLQCDLSPAVI